MTTTRHTEPSILLTLDEVGEHLRLSRRTVSRLISAGRLIADGQIPTEDQIIDPGKDDLEGSPGSIRRCSSPPTRPVVSWAR
ncbi:MAG: helix-turn-helix domain-containing protein [Dermatophilaceae bacterium]